MIVKGKKQNKSRFPWSRIVVALLAISGLYFGSKYLSNNKRTNDVLTCDAENVEGKYFINKTEKFSNANTQSSDESYSGKYSSKIGGKNKYGFSYTIKKPKKGYRYIVTVRRKTSNPKSTALVIKGSPSKDVYKQVNESRSKDENGWELLTSEIYVSPMLDLDQLSIFVYCSSSSAQAYFDDLTIEEVSADDTSLSDLGALHLYLDNKAMTKINDKRHEAMKKGILQSEDDDWVKAKLTQDEEEPVDIKVRLKGDWTDHLKGDYWSYRIKMPSDVSWKRMQTFSLQDPATRYYLHEWIYHKALEKLDVITPRYGFVEFSQNNQDPVLYGYEEHFDKQIAEYKNRREGVIMKFSEDYMWNQRLRNKDVPNKDVHQNVIHNADILPFKAGKTFKNPKLTEQFNRAQDLMEAYRSRSAPASEVFDMELMAKYYAITDVMNANHSAIWHNLRFYYNPVTRKLEPIGFDGYTEVGHFRLYAKLFLGEFKSSADEDEWSAFYKYIFRDPEFNKFYIPLLQEYSSDKFINDLFDEHADEIFKLESLIKRHDKPDYEFDKSSFIKRARLINKNIQPFDENSMKAFREIDKDGKTHVYLTNYHSLPLEFIGSSQKKDKSGIANAQNLLINSNGRKHPPTFIEVDIPNGAKYIYYKLSGSDKVYVSEIKNWKRPGDLAINYSTQSTLQIPLADTDYTDKNKVITIRSGSYTLAQPMIIPEGYLLVIEPNVQIDMTKKSYVLCYGSVFMKGTKDAPIVFNSSDKSSQGVTVIKAPELSILNYVSFQNLNTLLENEWQMTGAVTFYESDVDMTNITITGNLCEDALNLVRSDFSIQKLNINNTFADGFDGDFCKGKLWDSYLFDTGNDGLDYSGSFVEIDNVRLENIGDKGISAGEQATLVLNDVSITKAQIGIASKDLSKVSVSQTALIDCEQGFAAYQKKPEFGGGSINVESFTQDNVTRLTTADSKSKINMPKS